MLQAPTWNFPQEQQVPLLTLIRLTILQNQEQIRKVVYIHVCNFNQRAFLLLH